jgi:MFS family permease
VGQERLSACCSGVLTKYAGWEWIFFINIPVGVIAFLLAPRYVRESRDERVTKPDIAGAVTVTAGIALLVYAVSSAPIHGWGSGWVITRLIVAAALILGFLVIEARAKDPLMPFSIFRIRTVAGANVTAFMLGAVTFSNFFVLTLYVQQVLGYSPCRRASPLRTAEARCSGRAGAVSVTSRREAGDDRRFCGVRDRDLHVYAVSADGSFVSVSSPATSGGLRAAVRSSPSPSRRWRASGLTRPDLRRASSTPSRWAGGMR